MQRILSYVLVLMLLCLGFTFVSAQSSAPYKNCILSTDNGYNIILQQNNDCNSKELKETILYYRANGYNEIDSKDATDSKTIRLSR